MMTEFAQDKGGSPPQKSSLLKRISESFLSDLTQERCRRYISINPLIFTSIIAFMNIIDFNGNTLLKSIIIFVIFLIQLFITMLFWYRIKLIDDNQHKEIYMLQTQNAELISSQANGRYQESLCIELLSIVDALQEMKVNYDVKSFYTKLLYSIKQMTQKFANIPNNNLEFHLYLYDTNDQTVKRVAICCSVNSLTTSDETPTTSIKNRDVRRYYYAKCLKDKSKSLFALPTNEAIRRHFFFKDDDESIKRQFSQYIGVTYKGKGALKFLVEIISCNGVVIYDSPEDFRDKVIAPFSSFFKLIEIEQP